MKTGWIIAIGVIVIIVGYFVWSDRQDKKFWGTNTPKYGEEVN